MYASEFKFAAFRKARSCANCIIYTYSIRSRADEVYNEKKRTFALAVHLNSLLFKNPCEISVTVALQEREQYPRESRDNNKKVPQIKATLIAVFTASLRKFAALRRELLYAERELSQSTHVYIYAFRVCNYTYSREESLLRFSEICPVLVVPFFFSAVIGCVYSMKKFHEEARWSFFFYGSKTFQIGPYNFYTCFVI